MSYSIIAAIGKNNELGKDNNLIWRLPNDLKFFKETTLGHPVIMGSKTFYSLPKLLPGRKNIIISSKDNFPAEAQVYHSVEEVLNNLKDDEEYFIIGGASIYKSFLEYSDKLYLTEVEASCENADAYFPTFDKTLYDREELKENEDNGIHYKHVLYKRK